MVSKQLIYPVLLFVGIFALLENFAALRRPTPDGEITDYLKSLSERIDRIDATIATIEQKLLSPEHNQMVGGNQTDNKPTQQESHIPLTTIVTAYFKVHSKHTSEDYENWMVTMLSLHEPMVIFTSEDQVDRMTKLRKHVPNRTHFVKMTLDDLWPARNQTKEYWDDQVQKNAREKVHFVNANAPYQLFWVWLSKSWFVDRAIQLNPFQSEIFLWSDIGCFRTGDYFNKELVRYPNIIPQSALLIMAQDTPNNEGKWLEHRGWVAGAQMAGRIHTWKKFHSAFREVFAGYVERGLFVGEDQSVIQTTCAVNPSLCAVITHAFVHGNRWFGLQYALHQGLNVQKLWWFDGRSTNEKRLYCLAERDDAEQMCNRAMSCMSREDCFPSQNCVEYDCKPPKDEWKGFCASTGKELQAACTSGSAVECTLESARLDCMPDQGCMMINCNGLEDF